MAWHAAAVVCLTALAAIRFAAPPWRLSPDQWIGTGALLAGYLAAAALLNVERSLGRRPDAWRVASAGLAGYALPLLALLIVGVPFSRLLLALGMALGLGLLYTAFRVGHRRRPALVVLTLFAGGGLGVATVATSGVRAPAIRSVTRTTITSSLHTLRATSYRNHLPTTESAYTGGGIAQTSRGAMIGTGDGRLYLTEWPAGRAPVIRALDLRVPLRRQRFVQETGGSAVRGWFRVLDIAVRDGPGGGELYASYHHWRDEQRCSVLRLARATAPVDDVIAGADADWEVVYDTEPCLPLVSSQPWWPFRGMEGGGRIAFLHDGSLLLTVGDHGFNGVDYDPDMVQDPSADYGKTLRIDPATRRRDVYSTGHRNAQGLLVQDDSTVWLTEHGPDGGDELNLLERDVNYGWPIVTYGTSYGETTWPGTATQPGRHDGFRQPVMAFVPSVGASNLIRVTGTELPSWSGDLLMGSLGSRSVIRIRLDGRLAVVAEHIDVRQRVRDLVQLPDGRILILTDAYSLITLEASDAPHASCAGCHDVGSNVVGRGLAPSLGGVVGRPVGSVEGYRYSDALAALGGVWTEDRLDRFLTDPQSFAPGTSMAGVVVGDPEDRREIIRFLEGTRAR